MFKRNLMLLNVCFFVITVLYNIDNAYAARCSRIPEGSTYDYMTTSRGYFRIRIQNDLEVYKPGETYTVRIERNSNKKVQVGQFTGFFLAVEQKKNSSSDVAEEFMSSRHGAFKIIDGDPLTKLICGNVATHQSETSKTGVEINWTAPAAGSGCVVFRATIIEYRENWYKDDGLLTKEFCEDEEVQEDYISNVLETCCACTEAKYELTFEGLWSRNTHPKGFPRSAFSTRFGDIIGATHTKDSEFWISGTIASDGLREVADTGSTQTLEKELKNKSDSIRTIIKARGLSYPNITGKTFAVFRVDWIHHLVSFISMISPSPDWFVGISNLELCREDCTWAESKIVDLYPWDAGTDKGLTYDSPDQPLRTQETIRRITSDSPSFIESPFFNPNGLKMKPLARLTLSRQRLYEKNCSAGQTAGYDCQVSEYDEWGECTGAVCGQMGKQYRQRYYKNADSATKCNRKLFETKICMMPQCTDDENNYENVAVDDECVLEYYDMGSCRPNCTKVQWGRYPQDKRKSCSLRPPTGPMTKEVNCSGGRCQIGNEQTNNQEQPDENNGGGAGGGGGDGSGSGDTIRRENVCEYKDWEDSTQCNVKCGRGTKHQLRRPKNVNGCPEYSQQIECWASESCKNKELCKSRANLYKCKREEGDNIVYNLFFFYNATTCSCNQVFSSSCKLMPNANMFEKYVDCKESCPEDNCRN